MTKRPAFQFYPSDWRTDPGLRLCSIAARGLWIEMLCLMHEGEPYGHLTVQGRQISSDMLARLVGEPPASVKKWLKELEENDVFSLSEEGVIFSRRMVRDEEVRERRAAGGEAGASHGKKGASHGVKGGRPRGKKPPSGDEERGVSKPPPSSSSSSSSSEEVRLSNDNRANPDSDKAFWDTAKGYLGPKNASLIGRWVRDHGREATAAAISAAQVERAVNPVEFIQGRFRKEAGQGQPVVPL